MNRDYQTEQHEASLAAYDKGIIKQLNVMATGTGKTWCFAQVPGLFHSRLPGQTLVLAHRDELLNQALETFHTINPNLKLGKEKGSERADPSTDDVIVASVGSMHPERIKTYYPEHVDKVIVDEAHHSTAASYIDILKYFKLVDCPDPGKRLVTGWTATPQRADGEALARVYQQVVFSYTLRQAIEDGWLVDVRGYMVHTPVELTAKDLDSEQRLGNLVNTPARNRLACLAYQDYGKGRPFIGFCVTIQHARDAAELFNAFGIRCCAVWGDDPKREEKLALFEEGYYQGVFNPDLLTEGYDNWKVGCILNMAPGRSQVKYVQRVGRATRLQKGTGNLLSAKGEVKRECIVIDLVDSSSRISLATLPTLMGLPGSLQLSGRSLLASAREIEALQEQYPHLDLSALPDINSLNTFVEEVNLFEVKFRPEVEANSEMTWFPDINGDWTLWLPDKEKITIAQNLLDTYEIRGKIHGQGYKGQRKTLEEAFQAADGIITKYAPNLLKLTKREQLWHDKPASEKQMKLVKKLYKGKQIPQDLTSGAASKLIGSAMAGKAKKK